MTEANIAYDHSLVPIRMRLRQAPFLTTWTGTPAPTFGRSGPNLGVQLEALRTGAQFSQMTTARNAHQADIATVVTYRGPDGNKRARVPSRA